MKGHIRKNLGSSIKRKILDPRVCVIVDPQVGKINEIQAHGQLRSLPFLNEVGVENFTFVDTWKKWDLISYKYLKFNDSTITNLVFPICQLISQETELFSGLNTTEGLLNNVLSSSTGNLVLVIDSPEFYLKNNQDGKPLIEDWSLSNFCFDFKFLFANYLISLGVKPAISLNLTCNLVFHKMAALYYEEFNEHPKRLSSIFDHQNMPVASDGWNIIKSLATREAQLECHQYVYNCLRPWVESDIGKIVENIVETLQICCFNPEKVENLRKRDMHRVKSGVVNGF